MQWPNGYAGVVEPVGASGYVCVTEREGRALRRLDSLQRGPLGALWCLLGPLQLT